MFYILLPRDYPEKNTRWELASCHLCMGTSGTILQYAIVDRLGAFIIEPDLFDNNVPFDYTTPIYLISLLWKLGLELELHYFSIFTENNENEHLIFHEFHGR